MFENAKFEVHCSTYFTDRTGYPKLKRSHPSDYTPFKLVTCDGQPMYKILSIILS